jgi:TM2 domain-containing membrane protein YozV
MAATAERTMPAAFSAPVSQPMAMPPTQLAAPAPAYGAAPMVRPSYPAPPPNALVPQPQPAWGPNPYAGQAPTHPAYPQPVQVVIQNQIGPAPYPVAPYAMAPYAMAPYVRRKDAGVATLLSFFLPGAGQLYNGQVGKGLAFLLVSLFVNLPLMLVGVGFLTGLVTWIWGMIDAHASAERINRGEIVV